MLLRQKSRNRIKANKHQPASQNGRPCQKTLSFLIRTIVLLRARFPVVEPSAAWRFLDLRRKQERRLVDEQGIAQRRRIGRSRGRCARCRLKAPCSQLHGCIPRTWKWSAFVSSSLLPFIQMRRSSRGTKISYVASFFDGVVNYDA